jgi:hypothetical protein
MQEGQPEQEKTIDEIVREKLSLTDDHKTTILEIWNKRVNNPPSILELARECFGNHITIHSYEVKLVKEFIASCKVKTKKTTPVNEKITSLTSEQKENIINNLGKPTLEITKIIFNNSNLTPLHQEFKLVHTFLQSIQPEAKKQVDESSEENNLYKPPKTLQQAAKRINKYIMDCIEEKDIEKSSRVQSFLKGVIRFTHMHRYINIYNNFQNKKDKELFEASFIRFIYDKPDLQELELDLICNLCCDIVNYTNMQGELDQLKQMRDDCLDDSEGKRMSMSLVEEMKNIRKEMDDNHKRQAKTAETLEGSRKERMDLRSKESTNLLQVLDFWRQQEYRKQMIALAEIRKKKVKDEVERIKTMDDLKIQIFGITPEEMIS